MFKTRLETIAAILLIMGALILPLAPAGAQPLAGQTQPAHAHTARKPMVGPNVGMGPLTGDSLVAWLTVSSAQLTKSSAGYAVAMSVGNGHPVVNTLTYVDAALEVDTTLGGGTIHGGLWQDFGGLHWFVYNDNGNVVCLAGVSTFGGNGCLGGELGVAYGTTTYAAIEPGCQGCDVWYIYIGPGLTSLTEVASVLDGTANGAYSVRVAGEEQYFNQPTDPATEMSVSLSHPQFIGLTGAWTDWPASNTGYGPNFLDAEPPEICPIPYAAYRTTTDNRHWFVGDLADPPARCAYSPLF